MLGVLLESRARPQRRSGGVALSVIAHLTLIAAATAATTRGARTELEKPKPVVVRFTVATAANTAFHSARARHDQRRPDAFDRRPRSADTNPSADVHPDVVAGNSPVDGRVTR